MKRIVVFSLIVLFGFLWSGCKDVPSGSLKEKEYDKVRSSVKTLFGDTYEASNFRVVSESYPNEIKTEFEVEFKFDLNKPIPILGTQKDISGTLKFEKIDGNWVCTSNNRDLSRVANPFN
jgi:hypothetical protein